MAVSVGRKTLSQCQVFNKLRKFPQDRRTGRVQCQEPEKFSWKSRSSILEETGEEARGDKAFIALATGPENHGCEINKRVPLRGLQVEGSPQERATCHLRQGGEDSNACRERLRFWGMMTEKRLIDFAIKRSWRLHFKGREKKVIPSIDGIIHS